jgi:hypothetical protein
VNVHLTGALSFGNPIFAYAPASTGAEVYADLTGGVLQRCRRWYDGKMERPKQALALGLIFTVGGFLTALPAVGGDSTGDDSYWKQYDRIERRRDEAEYDGFWANHECHKAWTQGDYGPACGHAVDHLTKAINRLDDLIDQAEKLHPPDATFHEKWLSLMECTKKDLKSLRLSSQRRQSNDTKGVIDAINEAGNQRKKCMDLWEALKIQERAIRPHE